MPAVAVYALHFPYFRELRKIESVYKGKSRTCDFRGKKVCVVMAGNPYTETGEKFRIPDMLANRADIYNLGDIIGDTENVVKLSYIKSSLTSRSRINKERKYRASNPNCLPV